MGNGKEEGERRGESDLSPRCCTPKLLVTNLRVGGRREGKGKMGKQKEEGRI
jgi:hypothetical protein